MHPEEPEAYRIGNIPFLGLTIWLDSHPLIPRPETEWWVEQLVEEAGSAGAEGGSFYEGRPGARRREAQGFFSKKIPVSREGITDRSSTPELRVLDLCAGSGAIGCAILKYVPSAKVYFGEIDPSHKTTIEKNILENNLDSSRAEIKIGDLFEPFRDMQFDVIAANPPYIPEGRALDASVTDFEPALALRAGEDGLAVIRRIAGKLREHLAPKGHAWVECDIENIDEAKRLFEAEEFAARIMHDQYDRPRVLMVSSSIHATAPGH